MKKLGVYKIKNYFGILSFARVLNLLCCNESDGEKFRAFLTKLLQDVPHESFFWECIPISGNDLLPEINTLFEFTIVPSDQFEPANPQPFQEIFSNITDHSQLTSSFMNLSDSSIIICPVPRFPLQQNCHIAQFIRTVSEWQVVHSIWKATGRDMNRLLTEDPSRKIWLSTNGIGVPWFHIRLDLAPTYYSTAAYRK